MSTLFYIIVFVGVFIGFWTWYKTKDIINPSTLTTLFFIIPLLLNRLMLSGLQSSQWETYTYLILIYYVVFFVIVPGFFIDKGKYRKLSLNYKDIFFINKPLLVVIIGISIFIQLVLNYLNCGYFIPTLFIEKLQLQGVEFHIVKVSFWGLIIETVWLFIIAIATINSFYHKSKAIWFLTIISLLTPILSRFSRMGIFLALILVIFILYDLVKNKRKFYLRLMMGLLIFSIAGTYLMWYRWSVGGKYEVSFAEEIKYKGNPGPMEAYATFYGYFPLSFENVNRFVLKNKDNLDYTYGAYTFRPIMAGLFKIQKIFPSFPMHEHFNKLNDPVTDASIVPTAVCEFTVDFGFVLSFIPMIIYSILGLFFVCGWSK
jgi:oligosaccharide repeat unit polymerase